MVGGLLGRQAVIRRPGLLGHALAARSQLDTKSRPARNNRNTHAQARTVNYAARFNCLSVNETMTEVISSR